MDDLDQRVARWFAIRVGNRKEKFVKKQLDRGGIECFLPLRDRPFHYASKTGVRQLPLIAGYVFVKIVRHQVTAVLQCSHAFGFVKIGSNRRQVTQQEIEVLRRLSSSQDLEWTVGEKADQLSPGAMVEICRGPLAGVKGRYRSVKNKHSFVISFPGLDARLMTCEVSPEDIVPIDSSEEEIISLSQYNN